MLYIDNFGLRFNTFLNALEYNSGGEVWVEVPVPTGTIALNNGQILVGSAGNLATPVTMSGGATLSNTGVLSLTSTSVTGALLTGYVSGAGTVASTDSVLQAIQKLNGNIAAINVPDHSITPIKISNTNTDNFVFPNNVTLAGNTLKVGIGTFGAITSDTGQTLYLGTPSNTTLLQLGSNLVVNTGNVGIHGNADASASLDVQSTTTGFLPPRMTTTQRNAIGSPAEGLIVYDTTLHQLWEYQNGAWAEVGGGGGGSSKLVASYPNVILTSTPIPDATFVTPTGYSQAVTMTDASHQLLINVSGTCDTNASGGQLIGNLFMDGVVVQALTTMQAFSDAGRLIVPGTVQYVILPGDTSAHTYTFQVQSANTGSVSFGPGFFTIQEIVVP